MQWFEAVRHDLLTLPTLAKFSILMAVILGAQPIARRLRLPDLIVLLAFGVVLGPYVLGVSGKDHPIAQFFADLGMLMLMFTAGLEIDLNLFRRTQSRCIAFGFITTLVPQVLGTAAGLASGYSLIPAIVIGSLLASHTLLALPIVVRQGAVGLEPVVVAIGATLVSDTLSLIVFAICVSTYTTGFSTSGLVLQLVEVAIFVPLILVGVSRAGAWILSRQGGKEEGYFITMLGIMAVAGTLAGLIELPGIVGAFLAGLSVNAAVGENPAKEKLEFVGKALFIPIFFVVTGLLIQPVALAQAVVDHFWLVTSIIAALIVGKGLAAFFSGSAFGYSHQAKLEMWALTLPQVAATLAATLVGYQTVNPAGVRLLDEKMLNAVLVLLVVTSIIGPILTEKFTPPLLKQEAAKKAGQRSALQPSG
jgi:Kef-type K+ transport system membrane component KefB